MISMIRTFFKLQKRKRKEPDISLIQWQKEDMEHRGYHPSQIFVNDYSGAILYSNREALHEGATIRDHNKREYIVATDGSWRRKNKKRMS